MGVLKEFKCLAHGPFETRDSPARCPHGCKSIVRIFTQAPGFKSDTTKRRDNMTRWQANQMGVTDMSNAQGRSVLENKLYREKLGTPAGAPDLRPRTLDLGIRADDPSSVAQANNLVSAAVHGNMQAAAGPQASMIGRGNTLRGHTRAYSDPRGDPKL